MDILGPCIAISPTCQCLHATNDQFLPHSTFVACFRVKFPFFDFCQFQFRACFVPSFGNNAVDADSIDAQLHDPTTCNRTETIDLRFSLYHPRLKELLCKPSFSFNDK